MKHVKSVSAPKKALSTTVWSDVQAQIAEIIADINELINMLLKATPTS